MIEGSKIIVHSMGSDYQRGRSVIVGVEDPNGGFGYIKGPVQFTRHDEHNMIADPTFEGSIGGEVLQAMLDHAWSLGMRPKNWRLETTEQVAAMDNHLQDMRRLVFGAPTLDIDPSLKQKATLV